MAELDPIQAVLDHVTEVGRITNRDCRQLLHTSYDDTIFLLNGMCRNGLLLRRGTSSGTHYIAARLRAKSSVIEKLREEVAKRLA